MTIAARFFGDAPTATTTTRRPRPPRHQLIREHAEEVRYVARSAVAAAGRPRDVRRFMGSPCGVRGARRARRARPRAGREWAALHVVVFNLATVLLQRAIDQHLPEPLGTEVACERWHAATPSCSARLPAPDLRGERLATGGYDRMDNRKVRILDTRIQALRPWWR